MPAGVAPITNVLRQLSVALGPDSRLFPIATETLATYQDAGMLGGLRRRGNRKLDEVLWRTEAREGLVPEGRMIVARQFTAWNLLEGRVPSRRDGVIVILGCIPTLDRRTLLTD